MRLVIEPFKVRYMLPLRGLSRVILIVGGLIFLGGGVSVQAGSMTFDFG
jgi:hypothetical protein